MVDLKKPIRHVSRRAKIISGAVALLALGAAGALAMTRPSVEMAPTVPTTTARLPQTTGIVTVKGKVAEVYGNRFIVQDSSGRALIDTGPESTNSVRPGETLLVQGRYDEGQVRASYLVDQQGRVEAVGPPLPPPHGPHGVGPEGPGREGPPPPPPAGNNPPPPPPGGNPPPPPASQQGQGIEPGAAPVPPPAPSATVGHR